MTDFDPVTPARRKVLDLQGLTSSEEMIDAVLALVEILGKDVIARNDTTEAQRLRAAAAYTDTRVICDGLINVVRSLPLLTEDQKQNVLFLLAKALDDVLNLGGIYMTGKTKSELPVSVSEAGRNGGHQRGRQRRQAAEVGWHKHARDLASAIRSETPELAQKPLATEVGERWKEEDGFKPGFDSLLAFIRSEETAAAIPRRKKV